MMEHRTSAPGKLVLLGEYAVLFGHPAVVAAVDRRARVGLETVDADTCAVTAPGISDRPTGFDWDRNLGFRWSDPHDEAAARLVLVERLLGALVDADLADPDGLPAVAMTLDTREFFAEGSGRQGKLGLGSSAALTVAITEAVRLWRGGARDEGQADLATLLELHRAFQGGRGSGVDLAASTTGGLLEYRLADGGTRPVVGPLELPHDLELVCVWTRRSASTASFLAALARGMADDDGSIAGALAVLGELSSEGVELMRLGDARGFMSVVDRFCEAMETLGAAANLPVLSPEHSALRELAARSGVAYKPSGAGGGDIGVAFAADPDAATLFRSQASAAGFSPLDLAIDPHGVQSSSGNQD